MNTMITRLSSVALVFCFLLASCGKAPEHVNVIPKNASMIYNVHLLDLAAKGRIDQMMESEMMKDIMDEVDRESMGMSDDFKDFLTNPLNVGLDYTEAPYVFMAEEEGSNFVGFTVNLSSEEKFATFLNKLAGEVGVEYTQRQEGDVTYYEASEDFLEIPTIGVKDDVALLVVPMPMYYESGEPATGAEIISECFLLSEEARISSTPEFKQFLSDEGDINFWVDQGAYLDMTGAAMFMPREFKEITDLIDDNVVAYHVTFNNGDIEMRMRNHMTGKMKEIASKVYDEDGVDAEVLKYVPEESVACVSLSIHPEGLEEVMNLFKDIKDFEQAEEELMRETGFRFRDFISMVGGDAILSFQGVEMVEVEQIDYSQPDWWENPTYVMEPSPVPLYTVAISVGNGEVLNEVMKLIPEGVMERDGDLLVIREDFPSYMYHNDDVLVITSNKDVALAAASGGLDDNIGDSDLASGIKNNVSYSYVQLNPNKWPETMVNLIEEERVGRTFLDYMSRLDHFEASSPDGGMAEAHIYFSESDNALVTIWNTADQAYQEFN